MKSFSLCLWGMLTAFTLTAQVKIGDDPLVAAHPSAILELKSTAKGILIPRLDSSQQAAIAAPATGLIVFNTTRRSMEYYDSLGSSWRRMANSGNILAEPALDSLHWQTDTAAGNVFLRRGYPLGDSIFYNYKDRRFIFADKILYTNSFGDSFPATLFGGKHLFKSTASRRKDQDSLNNYSSIYTIMEADEQRVRGNSFSGIQSVAIANKNNRRTITRLSGGSFSSLHAAADTVQLLRGLEASVSHNSTGYAITTIGLSSAITLNDSSRSNLGTVFGSRIQVNKINSAPFKMATLYGMQIFFSNQDTTLAPAVTNDAYGLFINPVNMASPGRNYAIRTTAGVNILGDSTTIGFGGKPRTILDVISSSSMIIPTGTTAQRPAVGITGMLRINNQQNTLEHFDGFEWKGTVRHSAAIDVPVLPIGGGLGVIVFVPGAQLGGTVTISPAAVASIPAGLFIAWTRVISADNIEVRFENRSTTATLDPVSAVYQIRVIN